MMLRGRLLARGRRRGWSAGRGRRGAGMAGRAGAGLGGRSVARSGSWACWWSRNGSSFPGSARSVVGGVDGYVSGGGEARARPGGRSGGVEGRDAEELVAATGAVAAFGVSVDGDDGVVVAGFKDCRAPVVSVEVIVGDPVTQEGA